MISEAINILNILLDDPVRIAPVVAVFSVATVLIVLLLPLLEQNQRHKRLVSIATGEARLRQQAVEARTLATSDPIATLRHAAAKPIYSAIVDKLKLNRVLNDPKTATLINQAGFRGNAISIKIAAMRVVMAVIFALFTAFYVWVVLKLSQPLILRLIIVAGAGLAGWFAPILYLKNRLEKRRKDITRNWPDAMDLLLICVESGLSLEAAFRKVSEEIADQSIVLGEELSQTTAELSYLQDRQRAYRRLAIRTDVEEVRSVVTSLLQSEKYGTPVGRALRVLSKESRDLRMAAAEKKAASLPPKLTVPMILFFLPVLFAVIMTPAIIQIIQD